jgi:hypothetical protein
MRDTGFMQQSLPRTPVSLEALQEDDLIVAYHDDDDLQNDDAALGGAILLRHANTRPGSWDVTYRDGRRDADGLINLSSHAHIFKISAGPRALGHQGPWR